MTDTLHSILLSLAIFTALGVLLVLAGKGIELGKLWVAGNVKNPAAKTALDFLLKLAEVIVQASADRVRMQKAHNAWSPEVAKALKDGAVRDVMTMGHQQLEVMQRAGDIAPQEVEQFVSHLIESKVEGTRIDNTRKDNQVPATVAAPVAIQSAADLPSSNQPISVDVTVRSEEPKP